MQKQKKIIKRDHVVRNKKLTKANLTTTAENLLPSDSRIRNVDFAEEIAVFTKNSIIANAATAILAQANQLRYIALQLLDLPGMKVKHHPRGWV